MYKFILTFVHFVHFDGLQNAVKIANDERYVKIHHLS